MAKPNNWIEADKMELLNNLENFEFSEEELVKIINSGKGSILLAAFYKYNPDTHAGLIPTIQVNVRVNPTRNFNEFRGLITRSANGFEQYFNDFLFDVEPENIEVAGVESIYFVGKYTMQTQFGGVMKVRSRVYAIPYGSYFFQINFTDGQNKEDNSELFERLIQSVNVGR